METPKYELKINAIHAGELSHLVNSLAAELSGKVKAHIASSDLAPAGLEHPIATKIKEELRNEEIKKEEQVEEKPRRGRKPKTEQTEIQKEGTEAHAALEAEMQKETVQSSEPITREQIAQALQSVSEKVNFQKAKEILSSYKKEDGSPCKKVSDILAVDYAAFMADCGKAI